MVRDYAAVPAELRVLPQWVGWRREADQNRPEKPRKVLMRPASPDRRADSTDPRSWGTFDQASEALALTPTWAGLGFVFTEESGIVGADLDPPARNAQTGELASWAREIVQDLDSYTEVSPSRAGLHILAYGMLPIGRRRRGPVEMYSTGRYFTVTGLHLEGTPRRIAWREEALAQVHARWIEPRLAAVPVAQPPASSQNVCYLPDRELLERAFRARNGDRVAALFAGERTGYSSPSEADLALCSHLAYWTNGDAGRIDALFRQSGLFRPKWDERRGDRTYGAQTITIALASRSLRAATWLERNAARVGEYAR